MTNDKCIDALSRIRPFRTNGFSSFDDSAAKVYGQIRADLEVKGTPIGPNDLIIAAIALSNGLTLVTHNTAEIGRAPGLKLVDWHVP
jgi:tRNA(fMet)-specific endonuclease VapC